MKAINKMLTLCSLVLALNGCAREPLTPERPIQYSPTSIDQIGKLNEGDKISVEGLPLSSSLAVPGYYSMDSLHLVIANAGGNNGRKLLCYVKERSQYTTWFDYSKAEALFKAEIADGDEQTVTIKGTLDKDRDVSVEYLLVDGREIKF